MIFWSFWIKPKGRKINFKTGIQHFTPFSLPLGLIILILFFFHNFWTWSQLAWLPPPASTRYRSRGNNKQYPVNWIHISRNGLQQSGNGLQQFRNCPQHSVTRRQHLVNSHHYFVICHQHSRNSHQQSGNFHHFIGNCPKQSGNFKQFLGNFHQHFGSHHQFSGNCRHGFKCGLVYNVNNQNVFSKQHGF